MALVDKFRPLAWEVGVRNQPLAVGINCFEIIVDVSDIILLLLNNYSYIINVPFLY